jgi:hypothetical protein
MVLDLFQDDTSHNVDHGNGSMAGQGVKVLYTVLGSLDRERIQYEF